MIRFDGVSKVYRSGNRPALHEATLEVKPGEFVFLVGASGSGKSSFLRLILREERASSGQIHVLGQDLGRLSNRKVPHYRRNLGVVFQDFRLLPTKTVFDNVAFALRVLGKSEAFIHDAVPEVLGLVGLGNKENRLPHELSGGEQQRVAIARAVVNKPAILLADEPTGNLDPTTSNGIMDVLRNINAAGTTVLMATHDTAIVNLMQKRVIELREGVSFVTRRRADTRPRLTTSSRTTSSPPAPIHNRSLSSPSTSTPSPTSTPCLRRAKLWTCPTWTD